MWFSKDKHCDIKIVASIGMVIRKCEVGGNKTEERAFYLTSVKTAQELAKGIRLHWGIESTHWSLDVTFREDANRTRKGNAPQNMSLLRRLTLNMLKKDTVRKPKKSIKRKRFAALLDTEYLDYILSINLK